MTAIMRSIVWRQRAYEDAPDDEELLAILRGQFETDRLPVGALWLASGTFDAIATIFRKMLRVGDAIAVEDPCFMTTLGLARQAGYPVVPMPVDDEGVTPEGLKAALDEGARAVILTPRAHNPLGGSWSAARRDALREVLRGHPGVLLIEDDHYAVLSRFPPMTLVDPGRPHWAIIRSVSKYIGPDLRLAVVNASPELSHACLSLSAFTARWVSSILQKAVLAVLASPGYDRLVGAASAAYDERRGGAIRMLAEEGIRAHGEDGMNVWIPVEDEQIVARRLMEAGWSVRTGSIFRVASGQAIRITTSALDLETARAFAQTLATIRRAGEVERGA
jgi:DNA-binding transcriptional MocR family regulator